ncbi:MAG TPA: hypothetical protein VMU18_01460 [Rhodoblastus sp.]|nr:hypothetical protein [Rhodoblastus sp.]
MTSRGDPGVACHACDTSLSAWFFAHSPAGPKLVAWDRDFMRAGTFGFAGELKKIRIGGDDGVVLETGGTFQGETFVALYVFVFSNGKAILLNKDPIPLSHDNEGANGDQNPEALIDISGDWKIDGDELVINYTNRSKGKLEKSRVSWKREGNRLVKITGDPPEP